MYNKSKIADKLFHFSSSPHERRYSVSDHLLHAIFLAVTNVHHYLHNPHFCILTDRKPLIYAINSSVLNTNLVKDANLITFPSLSLLSHIFRYHKISPLMHSLACKLTYYFPLPQFPCRNFHNNSKQRQNFNIICNLQTLFSWILKQPMISPLPVKHPLIPPTGSAGFSKERP